MNSRQSKSSFSGKIDEIPGIRVDNFENACEIQARAYFLSHCHTDHMQGLHTAELLNALRKTGAFIYTTELTAAIIDSEKRDTRIMNYVKSLKSGSTLITLPEVEEQDIPEIIFTVTLIPASHCAGSTMFLFRTATKTVLFTGDFRINCNDLPKYTSFHENGKPITIDTMYVDTTFLDWRYENFPKRSDCVDKLVYEIKQWLTECDNHAVAIHASAKYGYEFVFNEIHKRLGKKVYVDNDRWKLYGKIPHLVSGVTNCETDTKIHLCRKRYENVSHRQCINKDYGKYLFIYLSAMKWTHLEQDICSVARVTPTRTDVCFATHCSKKELMYFINYFSPTKIVGFPNTYRNENVIRKNDIDTDCEIAVKKPKIDKKVDSNLLNLMFN